ncbi:hypothetical protein CAPTEDRAFT_72520, partial [Capitella teleta]
LTLLIGLIGMFGNGIVLLVIFRSRKTKKSRLHNAFVVNQTAMDLVSSVFLAMTFTYKMTPTVHMEGSAGLALCICLEGEGLLWIFLSASAFSLMSLTFERYIKIVFPIRHHTSFTDAKKATLLAMSWLVPFCWLLPFILVSTKTENGECSYQGFWPSAGLASFYGWTYIMMFYFIPFAFFIFSYGHMFWTLQKRNVQVGENQQPGGHVSKAQVNIIKTMVLVSACFAILWAPAQLYYFAYIIGLYPGEYLSLAYYIFNIICFTNSVINPFIYALKIAEFREMVLVMFGFKKSSTSSVG